MFKDNRSVTRFFQAKLIPPALLNTCGSVLQNSFIIGFIAVFMDTAAVSLRTEVKMIEKLDLNIRHDIQAKLQLKSTSNYQVEVEEELIYILPYDEIDGNKIWEEKTKHPQSSTNRNTH